MAFVCVFLREISFVHCCIDTEFSFFWWLQVITVGVVGGSDLVKISEQLGESGIHFSLCGLYVHFKLQ